MVVRSTLYHADNMLKIIEYRICCHDNDLITTSEEPIRIYHSKHSVTAILLFSLKLDRPSIEKVRCKL